MRSVEQDFAYQPGFLSPVQSQTLLKALLQAPIWNQPSIQVFGHWHPIPRLQAWMGDVHYRYAGLTLPPTPWHPQVQQLREHLSTHLQQPFNSVLLNLYRSGQDKMGWHADDEPELDRTAAIASISLGAMRAFHLRHQGHSRSHSKIWLEDGSLLIMRPGSQQHWQHALPASRRCQAPRINLTFRHINICPPHHKDLP
ncbi:alpha-ketoglutarate-dependent dioxygenase AlkB family protein [Balneatrix alpica]|uniref:Alpha-ketoglutarate-dependent dioxygenase AlkB n=1 Tax=Balneatrix alpica TaxID=75684 RepID=A0ABV5Z820_9GAMM|nr:alpha-ketoglutarate-dependent dioxygenase AlkB [Balneatrix alpica]